MKAARVAVIATGLVLGVVCLAVGFAFASVPGSCNEPGHNCGHYWVPIGVFLIVMAFVCVWGEFRCAAKLQDPPEDESEKNRPRDA